MLFYCARSPLDGEPGALVNRVTNFYKFQTLKANLRLPEVKKHLLLILLALGFMF